MIGIMEQLGKSWESDWNLGSYWEECLGEGRQAGGGGTGQKEDTSQKETQAGIEETGPGQPFG